MNDITYKWISHEEREALHVIANDPHYEWPHNKEYFEELIHFKRALVAYDGDAPVGYLLFQVIWGNTPFLSQIWINSTYHKHGIGKTLLEKLEERLQNDGYDSLTTSNETKNNAGIGFVQKMGFKKIGTLNMSHGPEVFSLKKL